MADDEFFTESCECVPRDSVQFAYSPDRHAAFDQSDDFVAIADEDAGLRVASLFPPEFLSLSLPFVFPLTISVTHFSTFSPRPFAKRMISFF